MRLCMRGRIQAVDVAAAGVVENIGLRRADEVSQLVVPARVSIQLPLALTQAMAHAIGILRG